MDQFIRGHWTNPLSPAQPDAAPLTPLCGSGDRFSAWELDSHVPIDGAALDMSASPSPRVLSTETDSKMFGKDEQVFDVERNSRMAVPGNAKKAAAAHPDGTNTFTFFRQV